MWISVNTKLLKRNGKKQVSPPYKLCELEVVMWGGRWKTIELHTHQGGEGLTEPKLGEPA